MVNAGVVETGQEVFGLPVLGCVHGDQVAVSFAVQKRGPVPGASGGHITIRKGDFLSLVGEDLAAGGPGGLDITFICTEETQDLLLMGQVSQRFFQDGRKAGLIFQLCLYVCTGQDGLGFDVFQVMGVGDLQVDDGGEVFLKIGGLV